MATILLIIIYLAFISLGLPDSMLGAVWPAAYAQLGVPISFAGIASVVVASGTVISSLVSVRVIRRFGTGRVTAACVLLTAGALMGISFTGSFAALLLFALPLGLGGGAIDAALNNYVALHYKASHMSFLHGFWGVGASISPLIVSYYLMQNDNWHGGFRTVSIIQFSLALAIIATLPLWTKVSRSGPDELLGEPVVVSNRAALKKRGATFAVLSFFFYCAAETSVGLWAATYFVSVRGVAPGVAAGWGSLFYIGIMGGRMLTGILALRVKERVLIFTGVFAAALGALLLALPLPRGFALAGLLLFGLGCAPIFPNLLHITPKRFGRGYSQAVIGLQMASAYIGSTVMPPLVGWAGQAIGFGGFPYYLLACLAALYASILICNRRTGFGRHETATV
jgi:fucose permease